MLTLTDLVARPLIRTWLHCRAACDFACQAGSHSARSNAETAGKGMTPLILCPDGDTVPLVELRAVLVWQSRSVQINCKVCWTRTRCRMCRSTARFSLHLNMRGISSHMPTSSASPHSLLLVMRRAAVQHCRSYALHHACLKPAIVMHPNGYHLGCTNRQESRS